MQSLRAAAPRARAAAAAASGRPAAPAISPPAAAAPRRRSSRPKKNAAANYNSGGQGGGGANPSTTPTVSLRLGSAADAATVSLPLPPSAARRLDAELRALHSTLRAKQEAAEAGERPKRWPAMEFAFPLPEDEEGGAMSAGAFQCQLYSNPNAHSSAFDAKVLVRVECGGGGGGGAGALAGGGSGNGGGPSVRTTGEARLTDVQGTLEVYWEELQGGKK